MLRICLSDPSWLQKRRSRLPVRSRVRMMEPLREQNRVGTKHRSAQEDLIDSFQPGPMPPIGPDGAFVPLPLKKSASTPPPRLCAVGPCVHYHTFEIEFDAQEFMDGTENRRVQRRHYCYPDVGIETEMDGVHVFACNRWQPLPAMAGPIEDQQKAWLEARAEGRAFLEELGAWNKERDEVRELAMAAADAPEPEPEPEPEPAKGCAACGDGYCGGDCDVCGRRASPTDPQNPVAAGPPSVAP